MRQFEVAGRARVRVPVRLSRVRLVATLALLLGGLALSPTRLTESVAASEPALEDQAQIALSVTDDYRTLEYSGPIVFGVTQRVREMLDAYPTITTLRLTSPGGRVVEARDLSELIADRKLTTVAVGNCASACTVLFMAGRERLLAPTTTLGFHRYHSPDGKPDEAEENMATDRRYFRARGIPEWFVERAFTTPNSGMWRPSLAEMRQANVITGELGDDGAARVLHAAAPVDDARALERPAVGMSVNASEMLP
jgi:hypothetical protein